MKKTTLLFLSLLAGLWGLPQAGYGQLNFLDPIHYPTGNEPFFIVAEDFNEDGLLDLALASRGRAYATRTDSIALLLGNGRGGFVSPRSFPVRDSPRTLCAGDLNGDGHLDLASTDFESNNISILFGNGRGDFSSAIPYTTGVNPSALALGDVDGDGDLDIGVTHRARDTGGDGDIVLLSNNGQGQFTFSQVLEGKGGPRAIVFSDFNQDEYPDLVVAHFLPFAPSPSLPPFQAISLFLNDGSGQFLPPQRFPTDAGPVDFAVVDLDHDGITDLIVANRRGLPFNAGVSVFHGTGTGSLRPVVSFRAGNRPASVEAGDLNRDGQIDLIVPNGYSDDMSIFLGIDGRSFTEPLVLTFPRSAEPRYVLARDLDGDGDLDLVVALYGVDEVGVYLNQAIPSPEIVEFIRFEGAPQLDGTVVLEWEVTGSPAGLGFNVYRAVNSQGPYRLRNPEPIRGEGPYRFVDRLPPSQAIQKRASVKTHQDSGEKTYYYKLEAFDASRQAQYYGPIAVQEPTTVEDTDQSQRPPRAFRLYPNRPNPFNQGTVMAFDLPRDSYINFTIFNLKEQTIKILFQGNLRAGHYEIHWDGTDQRGRPVASGVYLYRLQTPHGVEGRSMILLR